MKRWVWELREREAQCCGQKIAYFLLGNIYALTSINFYSREADILVAPALTAVYGRAFLVRAMARWSGGHAVLIQTDGGSEFKGAFLTQVTACCDRRKWFALTRRTNRSTLRASTGQCARSAWAGGSQCDSILG